MRNRWTPWVLALGTVLAMGCVGIPAPLKPAEPFEASRDLGQCYEIARLVWVEQDR